MNDEVTANRLREAMSSALAELERSVGTRYAASLVTERRSVLSTRSIKTGEAPDAMTRRVLVEPIIRSLGDLEISGNVLLLTVVPIGSDISKAMVEGGRNVCYTPCKVNIITNGFDWCMVYNAGKDVMVVPTIDLRPVYRSLMDRRRILSVSKSRTEPELLPFIRSFGADHISALTRR